ncbi:MAG: nucleotide exchange factor GrpE [Deltaproteobacteria bacterium]|nr:nucleotide exchange factor GrpE [Deltaproteobacteria bacterium]
MAEIENLTERFGASEDRVEDLLKGLSNSDEVAEDQTPDVQMDELATARAEAQQKQELYLRAMAEMDNLRKRQQREKEDLTKFCNENILREILPVIDNLERAIEHAGEQAEVNGLLEGVEMTLNQFNSVLKKFGVETIRAKGERFNPDHHQAMGQLETHEVEANHVVQELQKGYLLNNRLLRPAMVMVARTPPNADNAETDE